MMEKPMAQFGSTPAPPARMEQRVLIAALFAGCLPVATARWLRPAGRGPRRSPFASALDTAREAAGHAFSLPG